MEEPINLFGSICLSDIPAEARKAVKLKNGETKVFANISIRQRKDGPNQFGHTHFISVAPKKEERIEGHRYIVGDLKLDVYTPPTPPTAEDVNNAPAAETDALPF